MMPRPTKKRWKIRFSLRSLFLLFTVATLVGGWRYQQRSNLIASAQLIQNHGGSVFYRWQNPRIADLPAHVPNGYSYVSVPYQVTLPDGSEITKTRKEIAGRNTGYQVLIHYCFLDSGDSPRFQVIDFICGYHTDVDFEAVALPATSVDQELTHRLARMQNLKQLILQVNERFYSVEVSGRSTPENRAKDLHELGADRRRATKLIETHLPNVKLYKRGLAR